MTSTQPKKTLVVCDLQPDVAQKLEAPKARLWVDLVSLAVQAARQHGNVAIVYTQLYFEASQLSDIAACHPRLGVLQKLAASGRNVQWFTSKDLCIADAPLERETATQRTTFLPQSSDDTLLGALRRDDMASHEYTLVGYAPTVQAMSMILGDVLAAPKIQWIQESLGDENEQRCRSLIDHGRFLNEQVISMVEYLESLDLLHQQIPMAPTLSRPPPVKYVCDVGRGGHISLYLHYLVQKYGYVIWPTQPWYQEQKSLGQEPKQYYCPLGRRMVDLCDEPQFGTDIRFFLVGRKYLDEKDQLYDLVPELMPPTFPTIDDAVAYKQQHDPGLWFLKKVNQNGGRAVKVLKTLPTQLEADDQLQAHVPRPLLWKNNHKCHVKTYQWIGCTRTMDTGKIEWQLYQHDLFWLATADVEWSLDDTSDAAQITTMRTERLYRDHPWRIQWNLTELCQSNMKTVLRRAIDQGKLEVPPTAFADENATMPNGSAAAKSTSPRLQTVQFEIHSADWMLDEDGRMYLIECNGIPVLYDPGQKQPLLTRGLNLYDRLYHESPDHAVVNDHELMRDAVQLAIKGMLPVKSLWTHLMAMPAET